MKRFALFSCSLFLCLLVSKANPISRSQALNQAKEFLSSKGISMKTNDAAFRAPRKANVQSDENPAYYYVFNAGNDKGFVIVSGDDRTEKILGYSDTGSFDEEDVPEPLQEMLKGYEREIEALGDLDVIPTATPRKVIEKTKKTIQPMTKSKWGHNNPFNSSLPLVSGSTTKHLSIGCVPCTVGQLLYYYRDKSVSATTAAIANGSSTIAAGTKIDWDNMLDEYPYKGYTTTQSTAVGNLLLYCGRAMGTTFKESSSSTQDKNVLLALVKCFGYNSEAVMINREFYTSEEWDDIMYNELINGRLVLYSGTNAATGGGHSFLLDGYDSNGFYHVNWGWTGKYDGYFRLSILNRDNPLSNGNNTYGTYHAAFIYITPQSSKSVNPHKKFISGWFSSASGTNLVCYFYDQTGLSLTSLFGLGYLDDNNEVHFLKEYSSSATTLSSGSYVNRSFSLAVSDFSNCNLKVGKYRIVPIYKLSDESEWKKCQHDINNHVVVNYSASGISSSLYSNISNLSISNFEFIGDKVKSSEQIVNATITNKSNDYGYSGEVYLFASTSTTKGSYLGKRYIYVEPNGSTCVSIPFTPSGGGTYNIWIATNSTGSNVIGQTTLTIVSTTVPTLDISGVEYTLKNDAGTVNNRASIWGSTVAVTFSGIKNTNSYPVVTQVVAWLRQYDSVSSSSWNYDPRYKTYKDNAISQTFQIVVPAKATNYTIPVVFENALFNTKYDVRLEYASNSKAICTVPGFVTLPAVTTWKADGSSVSVKPTASVSVASDVVAIDITDATTVKTVTANSNPNTLYYMSASQSPSGLSGKNVVIGTTATKITLKEGYDFIVPKTFTAQTIQYSMTPTKGAKKGTSIGWSTISLPFDVTTVMNTTDNNTIDWFHSNDDKGKNFWVRGFEYLDTEGDNIVFDNSAKMLAYEPYIINVPGEYYGNKWNLVGKEITFYGTNAELQPNINHGMGSSVCNFFGTTKKISVTDSHVLNEAGDYFVFDKAAQSVPAFQGYFYFKDKTYLNNTPQNARLKIKFVGDEDDTTDGIMIPLTIEDDVVNIYNLNGVKVATKNVNNGSFNIDDLPKGVYIINGHKFINY